MAGSFLSDANCNSGDTHLELSMSELMIQHSGCESM